MPSLIGTINEHGRKWLMSTELKFIFFDLVPITMKTFDWHWQFLRVFSFSLSLSLRLIIGLKMSELY